MSKSAEKNALGLLILTLGFSGAFLASGEGIPISETIFMGIFFSILLALYLLPGLIAVSKGKNNRTAIFILNLLVGWTLIGWLIALIWSLTND